MLAVVAVVVVVGAVVLVAGGDDGGSGTSAGPGGAEGGGQRGPGPEFETWAAPAPDGPDRGDVIRTLATGEHLVIVTERGATAVDRRTGEEAWLTSTEELDADGRLLVLCGAASTPTADQKLPVTMGFSDEPYDIDGQAAYMPACGQVALLDLATGEIGSPTDLAYEDDDVANPDLEGMPVEVVGDTLVVGWYSTVFGLDPTDLTERWRWTVESQHTGGVPSFCELDDLAAGDPDQVVVLSACVPDDSDADPEDWSYFVDELAVTGEPGRSHQVLPEEAQIAEITHWTLVSASPLVIDVSLAPSGDHPDGDRSLLAYDDTWQGGTLIHDDRTATTSDQSLYTEPVGYLGRNGGWRRPNRSVVVGDTLVSFTAPSGANQVTAVDLTTGESTWTAAPESGHTIWQVLVADEETVAAVAQESGGPGQTILYLDVASGDVVEESTTEVAGPGGEPGGPEYPANLGYVMADDRAYGLDFNNREGEAGTTWLAFTVG